MPNEYQIRRIEPNDNVQVANIIRTVMTEFGCVGPGFSIEDPEVDTMYEAFQPPNYAFFVLDNTVSLGGCAGVAPLAGGDSSICELQKMYFLPAARGQGWGRKMMDRCLAVARQLGYRQMYLETVSRMEAANHLYHKYGFEKAACQLGATGHHGCDTFYIRQL